MEIVSEKIKDRIIKIVEDEEYGALQHFILFIQANISVLFDTYFTNLVMGEHHERKYHFVTVDMDDFEMNEVENFKEMWMKQIYSFTSIFEITKECFHEKEPAQIISDLKKAIICGSTNEWIPRIIDSLWRVNRRMPYHKAFFLGMEIQDYKYNEKGNIEIPVSSFFIFMETSQRQVDKENEILPN